MEDKDNCSEEEGGEIKVECRAGQVRAIAGQKPHCRAKSHFLGLEEGKSGVRALSGWVASARGRVVGWGC